jgi:DTW domain-containing protein YfiP
MACVCSRISRVCNRTPILILQHPRERLHPVGTARFATLGLANTRLEVAWNAGIIEDSPPAWVPPGAGVLYPTPEASDLRAVPVRERPSALLVIDGTWHTARTLHRDKRWLQALPHFRLAPAVPSRYRIRREPERDFVSTIEAIVDALSVLEPETPGLSGLLTAFEGMIAAQVEFTVRGIKVPRARARRPATWRRTPRALVEDFERLVIVYAESARPQPAAARELVQCVALELSTGRKFERLIRTSFGLPSDGHLGHMKLTRKDFERACDAHAFRDDWSRFLDECPRSPVLAAWQQNTLELLGRTTGRPASRTTLKDAYRRALPGGGGTLDHVITREELTVVPFDFSGRAGVRMAHACAIARRLNALARDSR